MTSPTCPAQKKSRWTSRKGTWRSPPWLRGTLSIKLDAPLSLFVQLIWVSWTWKLLSGWPHVHLKNHHVSILEGRAWPYRLQVKSFLFLVIKIGHYTSFVHMRGSVPAHWAQDISKIQPKPPIFIETSDPSSIIAGKHFNKLLAR